MSVLFRSASKQREWWHELALFTAWHVAAFGSLAKRGKLEDFAHYRNKLAGGSDKPPSAESWVERKAARQRQMDLLKRHQQKRNAPIRRKV